MRVADALTHARRLGVDRLDAQLLLSHCLGRSRTWLIAHDDADMAAAGEMAFMQLAAQRAAGMPLAYLVGEREFHGLRLVVTPDVLVPRPDTEVLVDWALDLLQGHTAPRVLDLGTGSGAIAIALAHCRGDARVTATDIDCAALDVARANAAAHGVAVRFEQGPWWSPLRDQTFDLVVSNPPYIPAAELAGLAPEVREHDPRLALDGGVDGLDFYRRLAEELGPRIRSGGRAMLEFGDGQAPEVSALFQGAGWIVDDVQRDYSGRDRFLVVRRAD